MDCLTRKFVLTLLLVLGLAIPLHANETQRVVALNGDITEIMFALGFDDLLVAVDASSNYPEAAQAIPNVGYQGGLSAEGILSFQPTLVIANESAGPQQVLDQLRASGVRVEIITTENTLDTPVANIRAVAALLGAEERGEALAQELEGKIALAAERGSALQPKPRILFLYLGSARMQFAGGIGSPSNAMILGAGGIDAGAEVGFRGYMPVTTEAVVAAQPDVIIVTDRGIATVGGIEGVLKVPGVAHSPAGQNRDIVTFEDLYFIGMGPRTGDALMELVEILENR